MENFALIAIVENLRPAMADLVVRRVIQHSPNGFIFQTRSAKFPALKIVVEPQSPALYLSEARPPMETPAIDFLMVLRKHLTSAELVNFSKPLSERIVEFVFRTAVPTKELETMSLIVELLPNAPNIILLDAERRVLSSFLPITPQHGIGEYETYSYPSAGDKLDLQHVLEASALDHVDLRAESDPKAWLISRIAGLGPILAAEIAHRQKKSNHPVAEEIRSILQQVRAPSRAGWLYTELPLGHILERNDLKRLSKAILSPIALESLERSHSSRVFPNIIEAAKTYFDELESRTLLEQSKTPVLRDLRDAGKRLLEREKRLLREKKKSEEAESLHKTAQMLTSSGLQMDQHYESVTVTDYFQEKPAQVEVPVDSTLTLRENIDKMFKRYQKAGRAKEMIAQQLKQITGRSALLEEQTRKLQGIKDWDTWLAISSKLPGREQPAIAPAYGQQSLYGSEDIRPKRFRFAKIDGREVLIGRNGRDNDELTFQVAGPDDFWFHVAEYSGSHVVVRNAGKEKELEETILVKAAQLAAYFSQARNSSKVEVHYTKRKYVTKPRRAKPGLVRLQEFKSIKVEPKNWLESNKGN